MFNKSRNNKNYIQWIRRKVGHEKIILVHAGGCIFNEQSEVLLQRRGDCNMWGFPGGALELGETPEMAAVREVKEETGLDVKAGKLIGVYTDIDAVCLNGDKYQSVCIAYELSVIGCELYCDNNETLELKYFPLNSIPKLFCKQHEELLEDIKSKHKKQLSSLLRAVFLCLTLKSVLWDCEICIIQSGMIQLF